MGIAENNNDIDEMRACDVVKPGVDAARSVVELSSNERRFRSDDATTTVLAIIAIL